MTTNTDALTARLDEIFDLLPKIDIATVIIMIADRDGIDPQLMLASPLGRDLCTWIDADSAIIAEAIDLEMQIAQLESDD